MFRAVAGWDSNGQFKIITYFYVVEISNIFILSLSCLLASHISFISFIEFKVLGLLIFIMSLS